MKRIVTFLIGIVSLFSVAAQKYVHYYMKDGSFNGFYTSACPEIQHNSDTQTSSIILNGKKYDVPMENVEKIVIEDATVSADFNGDYRIYEKNDPDGAYKKIIVDTRASLLASKNGDFGANDTILYSSEYNNKRFIFFTDSIGKIQEVFTGNSLYAFFYSTNGNLNNILETTEDGKVIEHPELFASSNGINSKKAVAKAPGDSQNFFRDALQYGDMLQNANGEIFGGAKDLIQNYTELGNNPELHNQFLIMDGVIIARDLIGVATSIAATIESGGLSWVLLLEDLGELGASITELIDDMFPGSKQMERYREYYQNKYALILKAIKPTNITSTTADLRGTFTAMNGINGSLCFRLYKLFDGGDWSAFFPTIEHITSQSAVLSCSIDMLKPHSDYAYYVEYQCMVDGMQLTFSSDPIDFTTLTPKAITLGLDSKGAKSAKVRCSFKNVPDGARCGIQYGSGGSGSIINVSPSENAQVVSLSGLRPNTTYSYRAFIQYDGETYYGETEEFTTEEEEAPIFGRWECVWTQTPPNAKLLYMTLNEDFTMSQTYYYADRDTNETYSRTTFSYDGDTLIFYKENGDTQYWNVSVLTEHNLSIVASDGFTYNFIR